MPVRNGFGEVKYFINNVFQYKINYSHCVGERVMNIVPDTFNPIISKLFCQILG